MSRQPDDVFGPDDNFSRGPIIDVTPKRNVANEGVDFDSDEPIIEQVLRKGSQGPDRRDKRPSILDQIDKPTIGILAGAAILILFLFLWLLSKLF
jgi:hypothetical protein